MCGGGRMAAALAEEHPRAVAVQEFRRQEGSGWVRSVVGGGENLGFDGGSVVVGEGANLIRGECDAADDVRQPAQECAPLRREGGRALPIVSVGVRQRVEYGPQIVLKDGALHGILDPFVAP